MTIASMTGFARVAGDTRLGRFTWEIKSVNAKGLDLRIRLAPGFDAIEPEARARIARRLSRGSVQATLSCQREATNLDVRVNLDMLRRIAEVVGSIDRGDALAPASLDGLLALRGVVEVAEAPESEDERLDAGRQALDGLDEALDGLGAMRAGEGAVLAAILAGKLVRILSLAEAADACPARSPEAIRARLAQSIAILAGHANFDENRLYQEALLLAAKADIREELDRLVAHATAAQDLLARGGPIGRRLDFLAQELGREASTLCAKSNDASLTALGLELRVEIEQFREQVQNIE